MNEGTTYAELRAAITECLRIERPRSHGPLSVDTLIHEVAEIAARRQMKHDTGAGVVDAWHQDFSGPVLHDVLRAQLADIVWDLIIEGILRPGDGKDAKDAPSRMPYLHLTAHGRKTLDDPTTPYDPAGYLKRLKDDVPGIDDIIVTYMAESIETLRRNCLLSSTVMMGCASEQAMLLLIEKTAEAFGPANRPAFELAMSKLQSIKQQNEGLPQN